MIQAQEVIDLWLPPTDVYIEPVAICDGLVLVMYTNGRTVLAAPKYELVPERAPRRARAHQVAFA